MADVIVLKPRRNNAPMVWDGISYQPVEDELGVFHLDVTEPAHLARMAQYPDIYVLPAANVDAANVDAADGKKGRRSRLR